MLFDRPNVLFGKDQDHYIKELLHRSVLCPREPRGLCRVRLSNRKSLDFIPVRVYTSV